MDGLTKTRRVRRRAWQIGRFELTCSLALKLLRSVSFFRTIVEVSK